MMTTKVLILGAGGALAKETSAVLRTLRGVFNVVALSHSDCNVTDPAKLRAAIREIKPYYVINCAAYTDVDNAERVDKDINHRVNALAPGAIAEASEVHPFKLIHFSTDYVYEGSSPVPYSETSLCNPINQYGKAKLAGELAVQEACKDGIILRLQWLHSIDTKNFLTIALRTLMSGRSFRAVEDEVGCPTLYSSVADAVCEILLQDFSGFEIYNYSAKGVASRFDIANLLGILAKAPNVIPIKSDLLCLEAERPKYTVLDCSKIERDFPTIKRNTWMQEVISTYGSPYLKTDMYANFRL